METIEKEVIDGLLNVIIAQGDRGAVVPFSRVNDLISHMADLKNGEFHTGWLDRMVNHITGDPGNYIPPDLSFKPRSLIPVIMPCPKFILEFCYCGELIRCVIPPSYTNDWYLKKDHALQYIGDYLAPYGYSAVKAVSLPQKLLSVHCGLGMYGRNNICYNDRLGSYFQIVTYISDLPCDDALWFPIRRMKICNGCDACVTACPTGAIDSSRHLINTDRCLTYICELPELPEWLDKDAHNNIFACSECQDCCPANAKNKNNIEIGVTFTEEETMELLNHKGNETYSASLAAKIETMGITPEKINPCIMPRNLAFFLKKTHEAL